MGSGVSAAAGVVHEGGLPEAEKAVEEGGGGGTHMDKATRDHRDLGELGSFEQAAPGSPTPQSPGSLSLSPTSSSKKKRGCLKTPK